jgi:hypothetical protein
MRLPKEIKDKLADPLGAFATDIPPEMSAHLTKLATFTAQYTRMPMDIRMGLIEDFDDLNQRNICTMIYCFEAMFLDELKEHINNKNFCINMFLEFCSAMSKKRIEELIK